MDFPVYLMLSDFLYCAVEHLPVPERCSDFSLSHQVCIQEIGVCVYTYIHTHTHKHIYMYTYIYTNPEGGN